MIEGILIGLKTALSNPILKAKVALFNGSKQSLVGFDFLESFNSPSDPAKAFVESIIAIKEIFKIFFINSLII